MFSDSEVKVLKNRNKHQIRELIRISFTLGVNLTSPSMFKTSLKLLNVILTVSCIFALYGHWCHTKRYIKDITKISESIGTALQTIVSIVKMIFYLFFQQKLYNLLSQAESHEIITKTEIFHKDLFIAKKLKNIIHDIMESSWKDIRVQLIFYICACTAIISNYFFTALFVNMYHDIKKTPNYRPQFPFPSVFPMWEDKGMSFPYYHIQMYLGGCTTYVSGLSCPSFFPMWEDKGMSFPYYHIQMYLGGCTTYVSGLCAVSFDGVFIVLCVHGVALIRVLNIMIENSTSPEVPKERRVEYLRYCIFTYQRIYKYVLTVDELFRHVSLSQFLLSLIIWGIVIFEMSLSLGSNKIRLVRMLLYILAAGFEIVLYCYNSQRLINECEKIPWAFYNCEWYNESDQFKQLIRMMILRTNRIFNLNVSWFTTMSLPTLLAMINTSGSYFLLLRNLSE